MPLQKCVRPNGKQGWKWGKSGKCHPNKSDAKRQMNAAYASGYKGSTRKSG